MRPWSSVGLRRRFWRPRKNFRRIIGWKDLWQLEVILGRQSSENAAANKEVA
jgi:hypothetical protein